MPTRRGKRSKAAIERRIDRGIEARIRAGQIPASYSQLPPQQQRERSRTPERTRTEIEETQEPKNELKEEPEEDYQEDKEDKEEERKDEVIYAFSPDWDNDNTSD